VRQPDSARTESGLSAGGDQRRGHETDHVKALVDHQPQARGWVRGVLNLTHPDLNEVPVIDQDMRHSNQDRDGDRTEQAAIDGV
jgi:hypothetical protein